MPRSRHFASASFCAVVFLCLVAGAPANGKTPLLHSGGTPAQNATQEKEHTGETQKEPADVLGRNTPHGTLLGFLHAAQSGDYKTAARYLQLSKMERSKGGEALAHELYELMDQVFVGRIGTVSDKPEGSPQPGVPDDRQRIGAFRVNQNKTNVDLVHTSDSETGENIWLFSSETLAAVPELVSQTKENRIESRLPSFLVEQRILNTPLWHWVAFILLIPAAFLLSSLAVYLVRVGLGMWVRRRPHLVVQDLRNSGKAPGRLILTVVFHWIGIIFLGFSILFREYYRRFAVIVLAAGLAWLIVRLINRWAERARVNALADSGYRSGSIILLGQRILNAVVIILAGLVMLSSFGFHMTTIAGLGVGSIVIAFAAQKTLENLLGGISIIGDEVIRVGETCRIGNKVGIIEDISLRSTRIRTLDSAQLSVPNGQLANMNIENLSRSDRNSFRTKIGLQHGTSPDQLRSLLTEVRKLLDKDPRVDSNGARVNLMGFGESSLDLEIYCEILTGNWSEFLAIREDLLLRIMDLVTEVGTQLALPSLHVAQDERLSQERPRATEQQVLDNGQGGSSETSIGVSRERGQMPKKSA